jgi:NAD(P)-dependent dehydrogenase (short-subunit alcohol dehydrogenase family)
MDATTGQAAAGEREVPKVALVTGGNTGIGLAICRALAQRKVRVLLGARNHDRGLDAMTVLQDEGLDVELLLIDITDSDSVDQAVKTIERNIGRLDILINNAAIKEEFHPAKPSLTPLDVVRRTYETNVFGTIRVIQAMLPLLRQAQAGRIVNLTSTLGSLERSADPANPQHPVTLLGYNSSKSAINAITVLFANELEDTPIKVNAADPGPVATPMHPRANRTPAEAVAPIIELALLGPDGPTCGYFDEHGRVPW